MQTSSGPVRVRFSRFELDQTDGELYRDGERVRLQEHPRQILVALLERPGELVSREDLRVRLWKTDTFVDFEHGLNTAVKKARQALGDSAEAPEFIETLARRGYRFIGRIEPPVPMGTAPEAAPSGLAVTAPPAHRGPRVEKPILWLAAALMLVAAIAGTWLAQDRGRAPALPPALGQATARLAVMPLRVIGESSKDFEYLGIGIADGITTQLANTREVALRPTSAVLPYSDAQSDPARLAAALGVQHLLLGTLQPAGDAYRISVQLVRADGVAVWGQTFDEPRTTLLQLQDRLAEQIAAALRVELSPPARARLRVRHTRNPAAYDHYLRGRSLMINYTEAKMREAIGRFEQALVIDPDYAQARAAVATAAAWFSVRYAHEAEAGTWGKRADQEAQRALQQDATLADAQYAIGSAAGTTYGGFKWDVVLDRSATALALDPSLDLAHLARMRAFYHLGLFDDARAEGRLAVTVNPASSVELSRLEVALQLFDGHFGAAAEKAAALLAETDAPAVRHYLGLARYYLGNAKGAREMLASVTRSGHADARAQAALASIEAASGLRKEARVRVAAVLAGADVDHHVAYSVGAAMAQLGDVDESLAWLERAADTGFPCYPWFERDPLLDPVRRHPGVVRLLHRLRDAHERSRRRVDDEARDRMRDDDRGTPGGRPDVS